MSESLDKNQFYRILVKEFTDIYNELNSNEWILCVPTGSCLQGVHIDRSFIGLHILKPSLLLKWHYVPLISDDVTDIEIDNMSIKITRNNDENDKDVVHIIGEEVAYNCVIKAYKIYVISSPFIKNFEPITSLKTTRFGKSSPVSLTECESYLNSLSTCITMSIKEKTSELSHNYLILPTYLDDAAKRFQAVIEWGIKRFDEVNNETIEEDEDMLAIAVESFVIGCVYNKIFDAVTKRFAEEDAIFDKNCSDLNSLKINPIKLGAQEIFKSLEFRKPFLDNLQNLNNEVTPLQKIHTLKIVVDEVNRALSDHIKSLTLPFYNVSKQVSIVGDDLVACLIYLLSSTRVKHMVSNMSFIQLFGGHLSQKNEFGYSLVTFEVAVEFIKRFDNTSNNESNASHKQDTKNQCEERRYLINQETNTSSDIVSINSQIDSQLENITRHMRNYQDTKREFGTPKSDEDLGDFLSSLSKKQYVVGAGKQTK